MRLHRDHSLGKEEAKKRVGDIAGTLSGQFGLRTSWDDDVLMIRGSGASGRIIVAEQSVDMNVRLGFALAMMEGTIRSFLEEAMDKHLV